MRPDKPTQLHELGNTVAQAADTLMACAARALQLGTTPPAAIAKAELALWRWARALHRATRPAPDRIIVPVVLLTEVDDPDLDPGLLIADLLRTMTLSGQILLTDPRPGAAPRHVGWRIRHTTTRPDLTTTDERHDAPTTDRPGF